jgi:hypothetical protein
MESNGAQDTPRFLKFLNDLCFQPSGVSDARRFF